MRTSVCGELDEVVGRQVAATGVADDDRDPGCAGALQPGQDPRGERRVVPAIAGQDDVDVGRILVEDVATDHADAMAGGPALRSIAAAAKTSMSAAVTVDAPARSAAIAHSPEPDARSKTRRPATVSGWSAR